MARKPKADKTPPSTDITSGGRNFKVKHTMVGPWRQDQVLAEQELLDHSEGVNIDRLLDLGAIEETDEEPTNDTAPGPENPVAGSLGDTSRDKTPASTEGDDEGGGEGGEA